MARNTGKGGSRHEEVVAEIGVEDARPYPLPVSDSQSGQAREEDGPISRSRITAHTRDTLAMGASW